MRAYESSEAAVEEALGTNEFIRGTRQQKNFKAKWDLSVLRQAVVKIWEEGRAAESQSLLRTEDWSSQAPCTGHGPGQGFSSSNCYVYFLIYALIYHVVSFPGEKISGSDCSVKLFALTWSVFKLSHNTSYFLISSMCCQSEQYCYWHFCGSIGQK